MKIFVIVFMTLFTLFMVWGYKDSISSALLFLGVYFILVYWALGYRWTSSSEGGKNTYLIINTRKGAILIAYVLFNFVVIHRAYFFGGNDVFFGMAWFSITSLLLVSKWRYLSSKLS
jgi:hypothetical protein